MAKFEKTVTVRTPDGVDHPSVAAAEQHMKGLAIQLLADASVEDIALAIYYRDEGGPIGTLRDAIRDVYLAAWPRANTGQPRAKKGAGVETSTAPAEAASEPGIGGTGGTADPVGVGADIELPPEPDHKFPVEPVLEKARAGGKKR